jgi:hypothetical protein
MMGLLDRLESKSNKNIAQIGDLNEKKGGRKYKEDKINCR